MKQGKIIKILSHFYDVDVDGEIYTCLPRGKLRLKEKPKVGDIVEVNVNEKVINHILPRKNDLVRPFIANVDQALLVFSIEDPSFDEVLLNRFLAVIEYNHIEPIIVLSKVDLNQELAGKIKKDYSMYQVIETSSYKQIGIEKIKALLKDKITVVTGQSGVGKSSLLNALNIELNIETNQTSKALGRGKHTTRHTELIKMYDGYIADTPGFSKLVLDFTPVEYASVYKDFYQYSKQCKFRGCLHLSEPYCEVKEHVGKEITEKRYQIYKQILVELKEKQDKKYG